MKKKKVLVCTIILTIIAVCVFYIKFVKNRLNETKMEKEITDVLNNEVQYDFVTNEELLALKIAKESANEKYDITFAINNYINNICICLENTIKNKNNKYDIIENKVLDNVLMLHGLQQEHLDCIGKLFSDDDFEHYADGTFREKLVNNLMIKFQYDKINDDITWYILNDENNKISLPYNTYADFIYSDKKNNDVKEILSIKHINEGEYNFNVEFVKNDGSIENKKICATEKVINNKTYYSISAFNKIYRNEMQHASLTFGQYDYDKYIEQWAIENDSSYDEMPHIND